MTQPHNVPRSADALTRDTHPVFADPSGQRRRVLRVLGAGASVLLVAALLIAGIGLFGGPNSPLSVFGTPGAHHNDRSDPARAGNRADRPGRSAAGSRGGGAPGGQHSSRAPSPSPSMNRQHPTPSATNKAGKTPSGRDRSKRPHPSPSPRSK